MAVFAKYAEKIGTVTGTRTPLCKFKAVEWKSNTNSSIQILASSSFSSPSGYCRRSDYVKSSGGRLFLVDTLAQVRRLEAEGIPSTHAEAITSIITKVLSDSLENVAQSLASKGEIQKIEMTLESSLSKFKSEVESSQGHHFSQLRNDIETLRTELRLEIDKVTAVAKAELAKHNVETLTTTSKLDQDIHGVRIQLEAAKYDVIKYCIAPTKISGWLISQLAKLQVLYENFLCCPGSSIVSRPLQMPVWSHQGLSSSSHSTPHSLVFRHG